MEYKNHNPLIKYRRSYMKAKKFEIYYFNAEIKICDEIISQVFIRRYGQPYTQ